MVLSIPLKILVHTDTEKIQPKGLPDSDNIFSFVKALPRLKLWKSETGPNYCKERNILFRFFKPQILARFSQRNYKIPFFNVQEFAMV